MAPAHVRPFEAADLPEAGRLLAARHRRHRRDEPLLSPRFEDPGLAEAEVVATLAGSDATGAVAVRAGRAVGYLLGAPKPDPVWGPNIWVESAGQALGEAEPAETARDLYAVAATRWAEQGRTAHYVLVPAHDTALIGAWFRLGFGHQHTHAVRDLPTHGPAAPATTAVRRATRADIPTLARLDLELPGHQGIAPVFSAGRAGSYQESLAEWEDDFDDPQFATFVVERGGRVVGSAVGCALERSTGNSGLVRPDRAGFLGFAAVFAPARGVGAGRALGEAVLAWCAEQGHVCAATDWRETNLLSSRAWPALGFRPTFLRLHRLLGY